MLAEMYEALLFLSSLYWSKYHAFTPKFTCEYIEVGKYVDQLKNV